MAMLRPSMLVHRWRARAIYLWEELKWRHTPIIGYTVFVTDLGIYDVPVKLWKGKVIARYHAKQTIKIISIGQEIITPMHLMAADSLEVVVRP